MARSVASCALILVLACLLHATSAQTYLSPNSGRVWDGTCVDGANLACPLESPCAFPQNGNISLPPLGRCDISLAPGSYNLAAAFSSPDQTSDALTIFVNGSVSNLDFDVADVETFRITSISTEARARLSNSHLSISPSFNTRADIIPINIDTLITQDVTFAITGSHSRPTYAVMTVSNVTMTITGNAMASLQQRTAKIGSLATTTTLDSVFNILASNASGDALNGHFDLTLTANSTLVLPTNRSVGVVRSSSLPINVVTVSSFSGIYHSRHIVYASPSGGTTLSLEDSSEITSVTTVFDGEIDADTWTTADRNNIVTVGANNLISGKSIPMDRSPKSASSDALGLAAPNQQTSEYGALFAHQDACVGLSVSSSTFAWISVPCPLSVNNPNSSKSSCPVAFNDSRLFDNKLCLGFGTAATTKPVFSNVHIYHDAPESFFTLARSVVDAFNLTVLNRTVGVTANSGAFALFRSVEFSLNSSVITNTLVLAPYCQAAIPNLELLERAVVTLEQGSNLGAYFNRYIGPYVWSLHPSLKFRATNYSLFLPAGKLDLSQQSRFYLWPTIDFTTNPLQQKFWTVLDNVAVHVDNIRSFGYNARMMWSPNTVGVAPDPDTRYHIGQIYQIIDGLDNRYPLRNATGQFGEFSVSRMQGIYWDHLFFEVNSSSAVPYAPLPNEPAVSAPSFPAPDTSQCNGLVRSPDFACLGGKWTYVGIYEVNSTLWIESPTVEQLKSNPDATTLVALDSFGFSQYGSIRISGLRVSIELTMCYPTHYMSTNGQPAGALTDQTLTLDLLHNAWPSFKSWTFITQSSACTSRGYDIPRTVNNLPSTTTTSKCAIKEINFATSPASTLTINFVNNESKCKTILGVAVGVSVGVVVLILIGVIVFCACRRKGAEGYQAIN